MGKDFDLDVNALTRLFLGDITPEERRTIETWVSDQGERHAVLRDLHQRWESATLEAPPPLDIEAFCSSVSQRIAHAPPNQNSPADRSVIGQTVPVWSTVMGAVFAVLILITGWKMGLATQGPYIPLSNAGYTVYTTASGEHATILLPDGSRVALSVASRLEVPADYGAGNRTLRLTGAAFFSAVHHASTPLTVTAGASTTRVLGTAFLVRKYETDSAAIIAVREGKVTVQDAVVTAQQAVMVTENGASHVYAATPAMFTIASGILTLSDTPIIAAIPELNRWYNVDIRIGDHALDTQRVTGGFPAGSITDLVEILEWTFKARVVREGNIVTIYPRS